MAYQKQVWEDLPSTNTPITATRLNHIEDGIEAVETALTPVDTYTESDDKSYSCEYTNDNFQTNGTILWENPNPSSSFSQQTITLSSNDYDTLKIYFKKTDRESAVTSTEILKGYDTHLFYIDSNCVIFSRTMVHVSDTEYNVLGAYYLRPVDTTLTPDDTRCVPLYIIGYKTDLFD